jgi:hypothetical protein
VCFGGICRCVLLGGHYFCLLCVFHACLGALTFLLFVTIGCSCLCSLSHALSTQTPSLRRCPGAPKVQQHADSDDLMSEDELFAWTHDTKEMQAKRASHLQAKISTQGAAPLHYCDDDARGSNVSLILSSASASASSASLFFSLLSP